MKWVGMLALALCLGPGVAMAEGWSIETVDDPYSSSVVRKAVMMDPPECLGPGSTIYVGSIMRRDGTGAPVVGIFVSLARASTDVRVSAGLRGHGELESMEKRTGEVSCRDMRCAASHREMFGILPETLVKVRAEGVLDGRVRVSPWGCDVPVLMGKEDLGRLVAGHKPPFR